MLDCWEAIDEVAQVLTVATSCDLYVTVSLLYRYQRAIMQLLFHGPFTALSLVRALTLVTAQDHAGIRVANSSDTA